MTDLRSLERAYKEELAKRHLQRCQEIEDEFVQLVEDEEAARDIAMGIAKPPAHRSGKRQGNS